MALRLCCLLLFIVKILGLLLIASANSDSLEVGFYKKSCPKAEHIVSRTVKHYWLKDPDIAAGVLRIQLHDCFVRGCDASVLLNSTKDNVAERDAKPSLTLDGFEVIDGVKEALEKECPGVVSCADVIALTARDAVSLAASITDSGKHLKRRKLWEVECGRRDGVVSLATEVPANLPEPTQNFVELKSNFSAKGLSVKDLVVLSGAHALGGAHCFSLEKRLYYEGSNLLDPTLDYKYGMKLRRKCKPSNQTTVDFVPKSANTFDNKYYKLLRKNKVLFHSDSALLHNKETRAYVYSRAKSPQHKFFHDFGISMVKLGRIAVLTGKEGQIRKQCSFVNQ